jgi:hypothetical protein
MTVPKPVPSWVGGSFSISLGGSQESDLNSSPTAMTSKPERTAFYNITILIKILLRGKNNYFIFARIAVDKGFRSFYIEETRKAAGLYKKPAEHELAGGLFHSRC